MIKRLFTSVFLILHILSNAQVSEPIASNLAYKDLNKSDSTIKTFSNSEPKGITFKVSSNLKDQKLSIKTNYKGKYKVLFIDYYAGSRKVYKNVRSNLDINIEDLKGEIFIMNISDHKNKLLTSQILNLRLRNY